MQKASSPALRQRASLLARNLGILQYLEYLRFVESVVRYRASNASFRRENRDLKTPPLWVAYDAFNNVNLRNLYAEGREQAGIIGRLIAEHAAAGRPGEKFPNEKFPNEKFSVLEWGCGPARILQHMPALLARPGLEICGTDYNRTSIDWCRRNFPAIAFAHNDLAPPLPFADGAMDAIYAISVFTHLSEDMHFGWMTELERILKPGGILLLTLHGNLVRGKLTEAERAQFDRGAIVVRGKVAEGSRLYAAFHPDDFVRDRLFAGFEIIAKKEPFATRMSQTLWIARKPAHGAASVERVAAKAAAS